MVPNVLSVLSRSFCLHRLFYLSYVRSLQMFHLQGYRSADKMLHAGKMRDKTRSWCSDWTIMSKYEPRNTIAVCIYPMSKSHWLAAAIHSTTQCYPSASSVARSSDCELHVGNEYRPRTMVEHAAVYTHGYIEPVHTCPWSHSQ
jgi:hypothetical protein